MKKNVAKNNKKENSKGYGTLIVFIIMFLLLLSVSLYFATKIFEREKLKSINYNQKSDISYKVFLNENEFYENDYLEMNKAYIANLIKYIDINYNYKFKITENSNIDFNYKILADLVIENNNGTKKYFEKTYTILDSKNIKLNNNKEISINENAQIDYNYYNKLANSFRSSYGVDTNNYLNVYLDIDLKSNENLNYNIKENHKLLLKIPLSEKAIEISFDADNNDITKFVTPLGDIIYNQKYFIIEIITFLLTVIFFLLFVNSLFKILNKKTMYDKYVNKILKEYDRLIVETKTKLVLSKYNVIEVKKFTELLDVRDNLKEPILYYNLKEHEEGIFYIKNDKDIYLLNVKNENIR